MLILVGYICSNMAMHLCVVLSRNNELKDGVERLQKENAEFKSRLNEATQIQNMVREVNKKLEMLR